MKRFQNVGLESGSPVSTTHWTRCLRAPEGNDPGGGGKEFRGALKPGFEGRGLQHRRVDPHTSDSRDPGIKLTRL